MAASPMVEETSRTRSLRSAASTMSRAVSAFSAIGFSEHVHASIQRRNCYRGVQVVGAAMLSRSSCS